MEKAIPTLEEFKELVKEKYLNPEWIVPEEEQLRYFDDEEAQQTMAQEYEEIVENFNEGRFDLDFFKEGEASRVAYLLFLMYE